MDENQTSILLIITKSHFQGQQSSGRLQRRSQNEDTIGVLENTTLPIGVLENTTLPMTPILT